MNGRFAVAVLVGVLLGAVTTVRPAHAETETLYVSTTGSDDNPGTVDAPFATLQGASDALCERDCDGLGRPVVVRVQPGTYYGNIGDWRYSDPTHRTLILGYDVTVDGSRDPRNWETYWGLSIHPENDVSNIEIRGFKFTRFMNGGIIQKGGGGDKYVGVTFYKLGSYYTGQDVWGIGGVMWNNVQGSTVYKSVFVNILNSDENDGYGKEHGVYLFRSSGNQIVSNTFTNVGGDPIRVRNSSNNNRVTGNTFTRTGSHAYIGDWYSTKGESRSWGNVFKYNALEGPHPWHLSGFTRPSYCYDQPAAGFVCSQQRIRTR